MISGTFTKLESESPEFRSLIGRAEVDKVVTDVDSGVPTFRRHWALKEKIKVGLSSDEMIKNEVAIHRIPKSQSKMLITDDKKKEVQFTLIYTNIF